MELTNSSRKPGKVGGSRNHDVSEVEQRRARTHFGEPMLPGICVSDCVYGIAHHFDNINKLRH